MFCIRKINLIKSSVYFFWIYHILKIKMYNMHISLNNLNTNTKFHCYN